MASERLPVPARKRYCVFGCTELGAYIHIFTHPERCPVLFETWRSIVGVKLKDMDDWRIYKNKRICDYHFTFDQKVASHRLIHNTVPTINLSGVYLSPAVSVQLEHNYCQPGAHEVHSSSTSAENLQFHSQNRYLEFPSQKLQLQKLMKIPAQTHRGTYQSSQNQDDEGEDSRSSLQS